MSSMENSTAKGIVMLQHTASPQPRRGLNRVEAAKYIGVSASTFDTMVKAGDMPKPVRIGARTVWDIHALDAAFDALVTVETTNPWAA